MPLIKTINFDELIIEIMGEVSKLFDERNSICKFTCEFRIGVEKVVPEILGRGGALSDAISSILYHGMKLQGRSRSEDEGNADLISKRE